MKMRFNTNIPCILAFSASLMLSACGSKTQTTNDEQLMDSLLLSDTIREQVQEFVHIFPSQVKVARLFKNAGLKFQEAELIPLTSAEKMLSKEEKSLALGMYGVDMVYSAMNGQTQHATQNLKISRDLSRDLGLESVYAEKNYVQKFEANLNNQDTLEMIIQDVFAETDAFLKDNKKVDQTLFSFAGGWTESVYLASIYALSTKNKGIVQLIGDQLVSLEPLIQLFKEYKLEKQAGSLISELEAVRNSIRAGIVKEETDTEPMVMDMDDEKLRNLISRLQIIRQRINQPIKNQ
jgi:hypothetical protein